MPQLLLQLLPLLTQLTPLAQLTLPELSLLLLLSYSAAAVSQLLLSRSGCQAELLWRSCQRRSRRRTAAVAQLSS